MIEPERWLENMANLFDHLNDTLSGEELSECFQALHLDVTFEVVNECLKRRTGI